VDYLTTLSVAETVRQRNIGLLMPNELERIWKEAVVAYIQLLPRHLPGGTGENHENLSNNSRSPVRDFNPGPPEYETGVLSTATMFHNAAVLIKPWSYNINVYAVVSIEFMITLD
jgi:hypothetical protein